MKFGKSLMLLFGCALVGIALPAQSQTPGSLIGFSRDVNGTLTVSAVSPGGCPTRVCTTNIVTEVRTNCYFHLVCFTNVLGRLECTNAIICTVRTNTFPEIHCTNVFLTPTDVTVREALTGAVTANLACDELDGLFSSNSVIQAVLYATLRTNDWRGSHAGSFKILAGTNLVAVGSLSGVNGVGSHRGLEACALCNHLEGTLHGSVVQSGPLRGARIQASYSGNLTAVTCPSATVPQGDVSLFIDGTVVTLCPSTHFWPFTTVGQNPSTP
jgi:hypothetical protein